MTGAIGRKNRQEITLHGDHVVRLLGLWAAYFAVILLTALPHGMRTILTPHYPCDVQAESRCRPEALNPSATNADIIRVMGGADSAFIARKVRDNALDHDRENMSLWPFWPPGMAVIETALYAISPALPVGLCLLTLASALWAGVATQLEGFARRSITNFYIRFLFPLFILGPGIFSYLLQLGVFYSETFSIAMFLLGIGVLIRASQTQNCRSAVIAGLWLAGSAYMRAQTDLVITISAISALVIAFISMVIFMLKQKGFSVKLWFAQTSWLGVLAVTLLSYQAVTFPYRAAHDMQWIAFTENPLWHAVWQKKDFITPDLQFYVDGGALAGCALDPERCRVIHQPGKNGMQKPYSSGEYFHFTLASFAEHPIRWLTFKLGYIRAFWLDGAFMALMVTLLFPALLWYQLRHRDNNAHAILAFFLVTTGAAILGPFLLMHIEERYMYQFKLLILYQAALTFALNFRVGAFTAEAKT